MAACVALAACGHSATMQSRAPSPVGTTQVTSVKQLPPTPTPNLNVSAELMQKCNIDISNIDTAPKFDFDRSALLDPDISVLDQIAKCVTTGPLAGRSLKLVGRADPRGEIEYNFLLGERRANSAGDYLIDMGVNREKINETSRGKLDATGTDGPSWARDRRVDIDLE
jgi:peptidoglycan-associated lipoprotein